MRAARGRRIAIRARSAITMAGEAAASGPDLNRPLRKIDNCLLLCADGRIAAISYGASQKIPLGFQLVDAGDVCLMPAPVNAHTHLQYSWLKNSLEWGSGFGAWLKSLVPPLLKKLAALDNFANDGELAQAVVCACQQMAASGTVLAGDHGASIPGALSFVNAAGSACGLQIQNFCEWFGFDGNTPSVWPLRCAAENPATLNAAPCGHALYSTSPERLCAAHAYCSQRRLPFSFHLAESPEETDLLTRGHGAVYDLYAGKVLPQDWKAPGLAPVAYAARLGILSPHTLAIHCVQTDRKDIGILAANGVSVCLCPRSNHNLAVGVAPVRAMLEGGLNLCLGTDGLTSNTDLDVRNEALWLLENLDIAPRALLRMLTVNGAVALGYPADTAWLAPGAIASFGIVPAALIQ